MTTSIKYLDEPPAGWVALHACRTASRGWNWAALMVDRADESSAWVRIPGKHRSRQQARDAYEAWFDTD